MALFFAAAVLWLGGSICLATLHAELAIAFFSKLTDQGSSKLNDGLGDFNKMMSRLDVGDFGGDKIFQESANQAMKAAAVTYSDSVGAAGDRILDPKPETNQERAEIQFFQENAAKYGLKLPISQRALIMATTQLVRTFAERIQKLDLESLAKDIRARQAVATESVRLQHFLISITTMLRFG